MIFSQCTPISNDSALPNSSNSVSNVSLLSIHFEDQDILKIIRSLNYNKAHGYDDISTRLLLKICDSSIVRPFSIIFKNCLQTGTFHNNWKKSNVLPIHKKVTNICYKTTAQSRCYQYVLKFLKELSSTRCLNFLKKIISSVHTNRDFVHLTHVKASYYPLFMTSMLVLIKFLPLT